MKKPIAFGFMVLCGLLLIGQTKTVHVYVALADNANQGIVPVPAKLGNGKDPGNNLYWGAAYGMKSYFRYRTDDWKLIKTVKSPRPEILERILFKHTTTDTYLLADAYAGDRIKACVEDFLKSSNGQQPIEVTEEETKLNFGGGAQLVAYIGHDGLMDFNVEMKYEPATDKKDAIVLACYSKDYFTYDMQQANANPILWTTHLMAPEAYTLKSALDGWILNESGAEIDERAAQAYHKYQKCGINGARRLFTTGF